MWARGFRAVRVNMQGVIVNGKAALGGDFFLAALDFLVEKLFHPSALYAYQMVVMAAAIEFVNGFVAVEMMADQQSGLFELGQHTVHGGKTDIDIFGNQQAINFFSVKVAFFRTLEQIEDFQSGQSGFEADAFQIAGVAHDGECLVQVI